MVTFFSYSIALDAAIVYMAKGIISLEQAKAIADIKVLHAAMDADNLAQAVVS